MGSRVSDLARFRGGEVVLEVHVEALTAVDVGFVSVLVSCDEVITLGGTDRVRVVMLSEAVPLALSPDEDAQVVVADVCEGRLPPGLHQSDPMRVPRAMTNPIDVVVDGNGAFDAPGARECTVFL